MAATERVLARLFELGPVAGMTDGQLLDRFTTRRGDAAEAAFEALVKRHGPMVSRVCRGCLRDEHDVEDAFQATFLVLVRRANALGERDLLGPWLYGVAHRVARKARAVAARRRGREGASADVDPPARLDTAGTVQVELGPVLHEEVDRLPAKYRAPVILCHLQGLTHAEAARELAWPVGTVSVRLARARKILADRLARRGVTASVAVVSAGLAAEASAAAATLAPSWVHAAAVAALTAASGLPLTTGTAAVSAGAVTLARRTSMTLLLSSWNWLTIPAAIALTTGTGAALVGSTSARNHPQAIPDPAQPQVAAPAPTPQPGDAARPPVVPPQPRDQPEQIVFVGDDLVIQGTLDGLEKTAKQIAESNPNATYHLQVAGGRLRFVADGTQTVQAVDPKAIPDPGRSPLNVGAKVETVNIHGAKYPAPADLLSAAGHTTIVVQSNPAQSAVNPADPAAPLPAANSKDVVLLDEDGDGQPESLGNIPPGYFDLPASKLGTPGAPQPVRVGQTLRIGVLEALPGRPLHGDDRTVRTDGTISLGYYGDLYVLGLNRDQIKLKVIEKLRTYLSDNVLGLTGYKFGNRVIIPPVESNRVFIDDQPNRLPTPTATREPAPTPAASGTPRPMAGPAPVQVGQTILVEVLQALPGRPISGERVVHPDGTISLNFYGHLPVAGLTRDQIKVKVIELLRGKVADKTLGLVKVDAQGNKQVVAPVDSDAVFVDDMVPGVAPQATDEVEKLRGQVTDLSGKVDAVLKAIEQLQRDQNRGPADPPRR